MPFHRQCGEAVDPLPWRNTYGETLYWCPQCHGHVQEPEIWQEPSADTSAFAPEPADSLQG